MDPLTECRGILARSGSNFALAFRLLPPAQRDAMTAFYAYCREVDDAVDGVEPSSARARVGEWRRRIAAVYEGRPEDPVSRSLQWAAGRFGIRREHLELLLDGVESDIGHKAPRSFEDLYEYCYRVASSVGLVCVTVLGDTSEDARRYAELTGIAVQLTNILRDVGEDAALLRVYLPDEDLDAFGVSRLDVLGRRMTPALRRLLSFEARRARHFYDLGAAALPPGARRRLFFAEALRDTYRALLERLEADGFPVFERRVTIGTGRRLAIALRHRLHPATWLPRWGSR